MITSALIGASFSGRVDYDLALAQAGFDSLDIETTIVRSTLDARPISAEVLLVDGLNQVQGALRRAGRQRPPWLDYPPELESFYGRRMWSETWGELKNRDGDFFVKRAGKSSFQPMLARFPYDKREQPGNVDPYNICHLDDTDVLLVSEPVRFVSEWRAFVIDREVVDMRFYRGSWIERPNIRTVADAHHTFRSSWCGYCIDFGVTDDGRTLVVETNAGYSLGAYGLAPELYARLLMAAWPSVWGVK